MKWAALVALISCCVLALGQEVEVTPGKGSILLSLEAQKSYQWLASEQKQPTLSVQCAQKGKKSVHLLLFTAQSSVMEDDPETAGRGGQLTFHMTIGTTKQVTTWIPYGDAVTYAYYGKTEPDRVQFLQHLLNAPTASIQFKPFLTGTKVISVFDVAKLREEMDKHPECSLK
ncbi:MAG TPA: hypothetical protein VKB58_02795 [Terriglobales bacterium]|nr:hypothetical protein [Terriglobales bacterium]